MLPEHALVFILRARFLIKRDGTMSVITEGSSFRAGAAAAANPLTDGELDVPPDGEHFQAIRDRLDLRDWQDQFDTPFTLACQHDRNDSPLWVAPGPGIPVLRVHTGDIVGELGLGEGDGIRPGDGERGEMIECEEVGH